MTDFELALKVGTAMIVLFGFSFGIFWKLLTDVKKSAHARIDRVEKDFSTMETVCNTRLATYVNKEDMKDLRVDMTNQFRGLTTRIDSLILVFKNGKT